jgi:hypothetical protein
LGGPSLGGNSLGVDWGLEVLLDEVHLRSEGAVRLPLAAGAGRSLLKHLVYLLKSETIGLRDEEVGKEERNAAESTPHEEYVRAETSGVVTVGNEVGGNDTNDAVPEPAID